MDDTLVRYLLGSLPEGESQRLDELSIADDDFAARLKAAEDDLLDAYVAGELSPDERTRFEAVYAATIEGRARIAFARALAERTREPRRAERSWPAALAAAAVVLLAAGGYLLMQSSRREPPAAAPPVTQAAPPAVAPETAAAPVASTSPASSVLSFVLTAPRRSTADGPGIAVPQGTIDVELRLEVESDDFPTYEATLKDAAGLRTVWRSSRVTAAGSASSRVVPIRVPGNLLTARRHILELRGYPATGASQILGSYPFRVVLQ